ncbi:1-acyl-sn-glycerol-3-phosphate acyltransferase alpha-like [Lytechinus variegatus]|uniref:1-acyl-sn-glycerol-3-phosphate acyltransferase alpha-like n=1 Tax=Lytechinus variegatus TaxID=7654 RepID=UPI001BB28412|nr:1-acyl-sn-glycerol-3-phosphate acyltransferase alpha-like [Lytechinus variegatus]XP_041481586.1 1-acyl-sn-glycerol-3-phosphate acyltransferase alpha-like [Lytechinus variegatus]
MEDQIVYENTTHSSPGSTLKWTVFFVVTVGTVILVTRSRFGAFYVRYLTVIASYMIFGVLFIPLLMLNPGSPKNAWWLMKYGKYFQLPLCRLTIKRRGCSYPEGPFVVVCNHQSSLDSPIILHEDIWPGNCVVIMKKMMKYTGPFGLCLILSGTIFVDRKDSASAKDMLRNAVDAIQKFKRRVWVFPEGTRRLKSRKQTDGPLLPFKKGAFNLAVLAQVPIVPVVLSSQDKFFNFHEYIFEPGEVTSTVLPAIPTTGLTLDDVPKLAEEVRDKMIDVFLNQHENGHVVTGNCESKH